MCQSGLPGRRGGSPAAPLRRCRRMRAARPPRARRRRRTWTSPSVPFLKPTGHRQARGELAVDLALGRARADRAPGDRVGDVLRRDRVEELGPDGEPELEHLEQQPAGEAQPFVPTSNEPSRCGSLIIPFQPVVVRGFSKYTRIDHAEIAAGLRGLCRQTTGVVERGVVVVHDAGTDDDEQAIVAAIEDRRDLRASAEHARGALGAERKLVQHERRAGERDDPLDARVAYVVGPVRRGRVAGGRRLVEIGHPSNIPARPPIARRAAYAPAERAGTSVPPPIRTRPRPMTSSSAPGPHEAISLASPRRVLRRPTNATPPKTAGTQSAIARYDEHGGRCGGQRNAVERERAHEPEVDPADPARHRNEAPELADQIGDPDDRERDAPLRRRGTWPTGPSRRSRGIRPGRAASSDCARAGARATRRPRPRAPRGSERGVRSLPCSSSARRRRRSARRPSRARRRSPRRPRSPGRAEHEARVAGQQVQREGDGDDDERDHVRKARQQEERHRPPGDVRAGHAASAQSPRAEGEPAGAAGRQQCVGRQLGHPDLVAHPPGHPPAEDGPEDGDVAETGQILEHHSDEQPARAGLPSWSRRLARPGSSVTASTTAERDAAEGDRAANGADAGRAPPGSPARRGTLPARDALSSTLTTVDSPSPDPSARCITFLPVGACRGAIALPGGAARQIPERKREAR